MPIAIYALALAAFAIGTAEFVISGILPPLADDLGVSIPTAGLLVTAYAIGVAIGGPVLTVFTSRFSQRNVLICADGRLLDRPGALRHRPRLRAAAGGAPAVRLRPRRLLRRRQRRRRRASCRRSAVAPPSRCSSAASPSPTCSACPAAPPSACISAGASPSWPSPRSASSPRSSCVLRLPGTQVAGERHASFREQVRELRHQEVWLVLPDHRPRHDRRPRLRHLSGADHAERHPASTPTSYRSTCCSAASARCSASISAAAAPTGSRCPR